MRGARILHAQQYMKHLFIIWEAGQHVKDAIVSDLRETYTVHHECEVQWTPDVFDYGLMRLYGGGVGDKAERVGRGPFTALIVDDPQPQIQCEMSDRHGMHWLNARIKESKHRYRIMARKEVGALDFDYVHASDTEGDTLRDVTLLFGCDPEALPQGSWKWMHDLVGFPSYQSEAELFSVLNAATDYVLLRQDAADIDLLVLDRGKAALDIGAQPLFADPLRTAYVVNIAGRYRQLDLRYVGDGYYDRRWQLRMIQERELREGIYRLSPEHDFYALYYHALIHKTGVPAHHHRTLATMARQHGLTYSRKSLDTWMARHRYRITRPVDYSVVFNEQECLEPTWMERLQDKWNLLQYVWAH